MYNFKSDLTCVNPTGFELTKNVVRQLHKYDISLSAKLVLIYLSTCYNSEKSVVYPQQKTIAQALGISVISVKRAVKELLSEGIILKSKSRNQNVYVVQKQVKSYQKDTSKGIKKTPEKYQNDTSLYRTNKEKIKTKKSDFSLLNSYEKNTQKVKEDLKNWRENAQSPLDFDKNRSYDFVSQMNPMIRKRSYFAQELIKKWGFNFEESK